MRKKILGIAAIAMIAFANLYLVSSDETMERLILLQEIESLARDEGKNCTSLSFEGKELKATICTDGINFYSECVDVADLMNEKCCTPEEETFCPVGTEPDPSIVTPGNANAINKCYSSGHQFTMTNCRLTCRVCGTVFNTCLD